MRFCFFHNSRYYGGAERHTGELATALAEAGHAVRIVESNANVFQPWQTIHANINIVHEAYLPNELNPISCFRLLKPYPADVAILLTGGLYGYTIAAEAGIRLRYPRVIRIEHNCLDPVESYPRRLWLGFIPGLNLMANLTRAKRLIRSIITPRAIAVSNASKQRLIKDGYLRGNNIKVVYNGTDCLATVTISKNEMRKSLGIAESATVFLFCGRLSREKGAEYAIAAFQGCVTAGASDAILLIVGDGPLEAEMKRRVEEYQLSSRIIFAGFQREPANYYHVSDCLILPSLWESSPLALLEAMHYGCFPIATEVGGVPEILTNGVPHELVKPENTDQLRDAMLRFLRMPDAQRQAARMILSRHIAVNFDRRIQYQKLLKVLENS